MMKFICPLLLLLALSSCKKLPKESHKGKDMMACYVDGEKWVAKDRDLDGGFMTGTTIHSPSVMLTNYFTIYGKGKKKGHGDIEIAITNFAGIGDYYLTSSNITGSVASYDRLGLSNGFVTDSNSTGILKIKYYEEGKICAGTFSFNATNRLDGKIISITDGRFDIGTFDYY